MPAQIIPTVDQKFGTCIRFGNLPVRIYGEIPEPAKPAYLRIPNLEWGKWAIPDHTHVGEIVAALNLPGSYDYAIPQHFFDKYQEINGEPPRGIWYYPPRGEPNHLFGEFLSLAEMFRRLAAKCESLLAAYPA